MFFTFHRISSTMRGRHSQGFRFVDEETPREVKPLPQGGRLARRRSGATPGQLGPPSQSPEPPHCFPGGGSASPGFLGSLGQRALEQPGVVLGPEPGGSVQAHSAFLPSALSHTNKDKVDELVQPTAQ